MFHLFCDECARKYCVKHRLALLYEAVFGKVPEWECTKKCYEYLNKEKK